MPILRVGQINAIYRDKFPDEEVLFEYLPTEEQYFRRTEMPFSDDDIIAIANKEHKFTSQQSTWVEREKNRMDNGVYAMINGVLTFIPGSLYGYVNFWTLENGKIPDYRNCTRKVFILKEYLCFHTNVLALTRGKSRRKGATSEGTYWEWWICGRKEEKIGGMVSYSDDSVKKIFQMLFLRGFKQMLPCFVEDFDSTGESFIRFVKPVEKKKKGVPIKREGLNSYVDFQPTTINSYDSGRLSYLLLDEFGKWEKVNINVYWSKVRPTLTVGKNKVGFAYIPTTVNPGNKGGDNYLEFWENANPDLINPKTGEVYGIDIPSRVIRIFDPATEGYEGCIDKFGESVIDDPQEPIMGNDGDWITEGSRTIILREREGLTGDRLMEHRRDFPLDEYDMFAFASGACEFNEENIQNQLIELQEHPVFLRQTRLVINTKITKSVVIGKPDRVTKSVGMMDDGNGGWFIYEPPNKENHFSMRGGYFESLNKSMYQIGVDTTQDRIAVDGSNPCIVVFKNSCIIQGVETGMYPAAIWISPTRLDIHFDEEVLKACMWYGCTANYELDRRTDFYRFFCKENAQSFLEWTPRVMRNPLKKKTPEYGTRSGDPFQLAQQLQIAKMYVDGTDDQVFNGHVHRIVFPTLLKELLRYNHLDRQKSDQVIALMMALAPLFGDVQAPVLSKKVRQLLPTYKLRVPA